jgi:hypothetical protein
MTVTMTMDPVKETQLARAGMIVMINQAKGTYN